MTVLAKPEIIRLRESGAIMIEPYNQDCVSNSSYDVTLGDCYWLEQPPLQTNRFTVINEGRAYDFGHILNPFDEQSVRHMWAGPLRATPAEDNLPGIKAGTPIIVLLPGQNILAHTREFIGTTDLSHTTMMKARSSLGRNQITVCRCAGLGDIGFSSRYTMEISNNGRRAVILVPGRRIAQILFIRTTGLEDTKDVYSETGKYQTGPLAGKSYEELAAQWNPEMMLPKMWKDREAQ